jgi:hypothetical protein
MGYFRRAQQMEVPLLQSIINAPMSAQGIIRDKMYQAIYLPATGLEMEGFSGTDQLVFHDYGSDATVFNILSTESPVDQPGGGLPDWTTMDSLTQPHVVVYKITNAAGVQF